MQISAKNALFLVSGVKKQISPVLALQEKLLKIPLVAPRKQSF